VFVGEFGFDVAFDDAFAQVNGAFGVPGGEFAFFADVDKLAGFSSSKEPLVFFNVDFFDARFGVVDDG
jgi:hypothetical protein